MIQGAPERRPLGFGEWNVSPLSSPSLISLPAFEGAACQAPIFRPPSHDNHSAKWHKNRLFLLPASSARFDSRNDDSPASAADHVARLAKSCSRSGAPPHLRPGGMRKAAVGQQLETSPSNPLLPDASSGPNAEARGLRKSATRQSPVGAQNPGEEFCALRTKPEEFAMHPARPPRLAMSSIPSSASQLPTPNLNSAAPFARFDSFTPRGAPLQFFSNSLSPNAKLLTPKA